MKPFNEDYADYLKKNFPIYAKKILKANSRAWFSRLVIPTCFFLLPAVFFVCLGCFVYLVKQPGALSLSYSEHINEILQNIPLQNTLMAIGISGAIVTLFFFFIGLVYGFSRASDILFEGEQLEVQSRQVWLTERFLIRDHDMQKSPAFMMKNTHNRSEAKIHVHEPEI